MVVLPLPVQMLLKLNIPVTVGLFLLLVYALALVVAFYLDHIQSPTLSIDHITGRRV